MRGLIGLLMGVGAWLYGQRFRLDTLVVKSSVVCHTCRRTIIRGLSTQKGIRRVEVDVPARTILVVYRPDRTNPTAIQEGIRKLGYDADSLGRDPAAYKRLPACCKKDTPH